MNAILSSTFDLQRCIKKDEEEAAAIHRRRGVNRTSGNVRPPLEHFFAKLGIEFTEFRQIRDVVRIGCLGIFGLKYRGCAFLLVASR